MADAKRDAMRSSDSSHEVALPPIIGLSRRPSKDIVSPSADPFEHSRPKFAGWRGSPATATPPSGLAVASTPQPTPQ
jgi:hypothetical protein